MRTQITLVGNLGKDPEMRSLPDGSSVCNFSVAVNRKVKGESYTDWFDVHAWGKTGELCAKYLAKGRQVVVAGTFTPRTWEHKGQTRTSLDVNANEVHFIGGDKDRSSEFVAGDAAADTAIAAASKQDDIPF
jgi:single-strand DNA-binding protein